MKKKSFFYLSSEVKKKSFFYLSSEVKEKSFFYQSSEVKKKSFFYLPSELKEKSFFYLSSEVKKKSFLYLSSEVNTCLKMRSDSCTFPKKFRESPTCPQRGWFSLLPVLCVHYGRVGPGQVEGMMFSPTCPLCPLRKGWPWPGRGCG